MKKVLVVLLVLFLFVPFAFAEGVDLSEMSDSDLEELNRSVQLELFSRHAAGDGVQVPPGCYTAGVDLPAGRYQVIVEEDVYAETIKVYASESSKSGKSFWLGSFYGGTTANIDLQDGGILEITSHTVTIRVFTSLF